MKGADEGEKPEDEMMAMEEAKGDMEAMEAM